MFTVKKLNVVLRYGNFDINSGSCSQIFVVVDFVSWGSLDYAWYCDLGQKEKTLNRTCCL